MTVAYLPFTPPATKTIANTGAVLLSRQPSPLPQGRFRNDTHRNWSGDGRYRTSWSQPETEDEGAGLVRNAPSERS